MRTKYIFMLVLVLASLLTSCQSQKATAEPPGCTLEKYKRNAQVLMDRYSDVVNDLELRDADSRATARQTLLILQDRAENLICRENYPLKQETLEFSIKHLLDALDYMDQGDSQSANESINKALLNVEQFNNWSVDV